MSYYFPPNTWYLTPTASDYPSTFYFITDAHFSKSTVTCAGANQWWWILISKWVVGEPTPKPHPWFVGTSGTSCCGLGSLGCRLWDGDRYAIGWLVILASVPLGEKGREGWEESWGRRRHWIAMQFQWSPQSNLWEALKLEWLFWIVPNWAESAGPHFDQPCSVGSSGSVVHPSLFRLSL